MRYIQNFLATSTDQETLLYCMWSLQYITRGGGESEINEVLQMEIFEDIFKCLQIDNDKLKAVTLRTIINISSESDYQMQALMNRGLLDALYPLLQDSNRSVRTQASAVYANLLAGTGDQVKEVIDWHDGKVIQTLMEMVNRDHPDVNFFCEQKLIFFLGFGRVYLCTVQCM